MIFTHFKMKSRFASWARHICSKSFTKRLHPCYNEARASLAFCGLGLDDESHGYNSAVIILLPWNLSCTCEEKKLSREISLVGYHVPPCPSGSSYHCVLKVTEHDDHSFSYSHNDHSSIVYALPTAERLSARHSIHAATGSG